MAREEELGLPGDAQSAEMVGAPLCIQARNLHVTLGEQTVLRGLDVEVPAGVVYTLLGPSGCGKTTLMKTLLGLYVPSQGQVSMLGHEPRSKPLMGKIGYVPQNLGLHKNLRVREHLEMYARISGLTQRQIDAKIEEYNKRFKLPELDKVIRDLSFGQQKLVSVCAALICEPEVAILDEPTVGLDPHRRRMLWNYFEHVANCGRTIFVTTHHVNEAYRADLIAIMLKGRLLVQASPQEVMQRMQVNSLEGAYLRAYKDDVAGFDSQTSANEIGTIKHDSFWAATSLKQTVITMRVVSQMFYKTIFRNFASDIFAFLMVAAQFVIITNCIGPQSFDLPVHILNDDSGFNGQHLGTQYVNLLLNDSTTQMSWELDDISDSVESCMDRVSQGKSFGLLYLPENFTEVTLANGNNRTYPFTYSLHLDATDTNIRGQIITEVYKAWLSLLFDVFNDSEQDVSSATTNVRGTPDSMTNFFLTSIFVAIAFAGGMFSAGTAFMREKEDEALDRLQVMGVPPWMLLVADLLPFVPWVIADFPVRMGLALMVMDGPFQGQFAPLLLLTTLGFATGNAMGVLMAVLCNSSRELMQVVYSVFSLLYLPSGCMWPEQSLPLFMQYFNIVNPLKWCVDAFRALFQRGAPITDKVVLYGILLPLGVCVFSFSWAGIAMAYHTSPSKRFAIWLAKKRS